MDDLFAGDAPNLLSPEEREYLRSFKTCVVTDGDQIKAFARDLSMGRFSGRFPSPGRGRRIAFTLGPNMHFVCYKGATRVASFSLSKWTMVTDDKRMLFHYPRNMSVSAAIDPPEIRPFRLRQRCASNLFMLCSQSRVFGENGEAYLHPAAWCDTAFHGARSWRSTENGVTSRRFDDTWIFSWFTCPGASGQDAESKHAETDRVQGSTSVPRSDFALNPDCQSGSTPDTVLLFESKPGWNQTGGPERFTFDNHEPKGGCVLLKDGAVKFIRTDEELRQLRWK